MLTAINTRGLQIGKVIQNVFTSAKTLSLIVLIIIGLLLARNAEVIRANFSDLWTPQGVTPVKPDLSILATVSATGGAFGLFVAFCVAQVGSLFSSDAWNNITFTAGEVKGAPPQYPSLAGCGHRPGHPPLPAGQRRLPLPAAAGQDPERPR